MLFLEEFNMAVTSIRFKIWTVLNAGLNCCAWGVVSSKFQDASFIFKITKIQYIVYFTLHNISHYVCIKLLENIFWNLWKQKMLTEWELMINVHHHVNSTCQTWNGFSLKGMMNSLWSMCLLINQKTYFMCLSIP